MASNDFAAVEERLRDVEAALARPESELVIVDRDEFARIPAGIEMYRSALALVGGNPAGAILRAGHAIAAAPAGDDLTPAAASALAGLASWTTGNVLAAHASPDACGPCTITGRHRFLAPGRAHQLGLLTRSGH